MAPSVPSTSAAAFNNAKKRKASTTIVGKTKVAKIVEVHPIVAAIANSPARWTKKEMKEIDSKEFFKAMYSTVTGTLGDHRKKIIDFFAAELDGKHSAPLKTVVVCIHSLDVKNTNQLVTQVVRSFEDGKFPKTNDSVDGYVGLQRGSNLLSDAKGGFRYIGADFVQFGATVRFWPPPIQSVELSAPDGSLRYDASLVWVCSKEMKDFEADILFPAAEHLGAPLAVAFRLVNESGIPTHIWGFRCDNLPASAIELSEFEVDGTHFVRILCCAYCGRNGIFDTPHDHTQCPDIGVQNKLRTNLNIAPLVVDKGAVIRSDLAVAEDLSAIVKTLRGRIDKHESRLAKLETAVSNLEGKKDKSKPKDASKKSKKPNEDGKGKRKKAKGSEEGSTKGGKGKKKAD